MSNYPCPRISETINGKELAIWGVEHTHEFFNKYKSLFKGFVRDNDAFVLEQPEGKEFWEVEGFLFDELSELIRKQEKRVYRVDPLTLDNLLLDLGTFVMGGSLILGGVTRPTSSKRTARRDFINRLGELFFGTSLLWGSFPAVMLENNLMDDYALDYGVDDHTISYGMDDQIKYGSTDYRNIVIAEGLKRICCEVGDVSKIGSIHGAVHSEVVHKYLLSPNKRLKRLAYLPHDLLGKTKIREYTPTSKGWELTRVF